MDASAILGALSAEGVSFFAGVPDSYLHGFCSELGARRPALRNVVAANEGNAVAIAVGHYLATGEVPLAYMQNSGLGNAVNPLASLACRPMLGVPLVLLVGWRGDPWHADHVQHELQGRATPAILADLGIPCATLPDGEEGAAAAVSWAVSAARALPGPVALLSPKGALSGSKSPAETGPYPLTRKEAIRAVLDAAPPRAVFCATTGRAARELANLRDERGEPHSRDYLNVGSMGHASSVALGIALARPDRRVVCLDGDAAAIMHMGAMAMASVIDAPNLLHVVLNNGEHESVGGEPSAGWRVDLTGVAAACGYETVGRPVSDAGEIFSAVRGLCARGAASFLDVRISPGIAPGEPPLEVDPAAMRDGLMRELGAL